MQSVAYSSSTPGDSAGPAFRVLETLREYNTPLQIDFVAKVTDMLPQQIDHVLTDLQRNGVIIIDSSNRVALAHQTNAVSRFFHWLTK